MISANQFDLEDSDVTDQVIPVIAQLRNLQVLKLGKNKIHGSNLILRLTPEAGSFCAR